MSSLDYENYDVVGFVRRATNKNCIISCIGVLHRSTHKYEQVSAKHTMFPPKGEIFASNFYARYPEYEDECVCIRVIPNDNEVVLNPDSYIWDWNSEPYLFAERIKRVKEAIVENGQVNKTILEDNGINGSAKEKVYFISGNKLYLYRNSSRLMRYWSLLDVSDFVVWDSKKPYLLKDIDIEEEGQVDITSDDQLIEWYKKKVLSKKWGSIYDSKDFNVVNDIIKGELMQSVSLPKNIMTSRLNRMLQLNTSISLVFEELEDMAESPWFSSVIMESIKQFENQYINKIREKNCEEIRKLENEKNNQLEEIDLEIVIKKEELENLGKRIKDEENRKRTNLSEIESKIKTLENQLSEKEELLKKIESRKEGILGDFKIIREILAFNPASSKCNGGAINQNDCVSVVIEDIDNQDTRISGIRAQFRKNLEINLGREKCNKINVDNIITQLLMCNTLLLPDVSTAQAIISATRKCRYCVEYVGVSWKSFSDLWNNGLSEMVKSSFERPEIIHYLILRNINMSYIPSYLQPLIDLHNELISSFPGTEYSYPINLKVLCTRTKDLVIPVSKESLEGIGCISYEVLSDEQRKTREIEYNNMPLHKSSLYFDDLLKLPSNEEYYNDQTQQYVDE